MSKMTSEKLWRYYNMNFWWMQVETEKKKKCSIKVQDGRGLRACLGCKGIVGVGRWYLVSWGVVFPWIAEQLSHLCPQECPHIVFQAISGPLAAATASILTNPMDVIRTRVQVMLASSSPPLIQALEAWSAGLQCAKTLIVSLVASHSSPFLCLSVQIPTEFLKVSVLFFLRCLHLVHLYPLCGQPLGILTASFQPSVEICSILLSA